MAKDSSFDVVSEVNMQEVVNAVNQARKEVSQRYDFKGSKTEIELNDDVIKITTEDDFRLNSVIDILKTRLIARSTARPKTPPAAWSASRSRSVRASPRTKPKPWLRTSKPRSSRCRPPFRETASAFPAKTKMIFSRSSLCSERMITTLNCSLSTTAEIN